MKDLVILAADKDLKTALEALLIRNLAIGIRSITFDVFIEQGHDPICARDGVVFLNALRNQYSHALLMFDYEGCGYEEHFSSDELEKKINEQFKESNWLDCGKAILLIPELEAWVWSDSPKVAEAIRWKGSRESLTDWLIRDGKLPRGQTKPPRPKEAFDAALYAASQPHSASLFGRLAENVSFRRCTDPSFAKFRQTLQEWFPQKD